MSLYTLQCFHSRTVYMRSILSIWQVILRVRRRRGKGWFTEMPRTRKLTHLPPFRQSCLVASAFSTRCSCTSLSCPLPSSRMQRTGPPTRKIRKYSFLIKWNCYKIKINILPNVTYKCNIAWQVFFRREQQLYRLLCPSICTRVFSVHTKHSHEFECFSNSSLNRKKVERKI